MPLKGAIQNYAGGCMGCSNKLREAPFNSILLPQRPSAGSNWSPPAPVGAAKRVLEVAISQSRVRRREQIPVFGCAGRQRASVCGCVGISAGRGELSPEGGDLRELQRSRCCPSGIDARADAVRCVIGLTCASQRSTARRVPRAVRRRRHPSWDGAAHRLSRQQASRSEQASLAPVCLNSQSSTMTPLLWS